ncbi:MAG: hypothetical protein RO257_12355 [Candidatus Kapabacteria bacterium]|nr:hypothetical protein [Candidatus Kapabacteria bacterium]
MNISYAQEGGEKEKPTVEELKDRIDGIDESVNALITDVSGLKKIKVSGYMQIQFDKTEANRSFTMSPYDSSDFDQSRFRVRRSRLKVTYDAGLTQYVLQGDFSNTGFSLKDAYIKITDPWLQYFSLQTGVFNRPAYEVEYSSSQRESMERSKIISTLYPGERDLGAMLIVNPDEMFKFQFAAFNNTFKGTFSQADPNFNNEPLYYMARLIKEFALTDLGLGIDLGVHARFGNAIANTNSVLESDKGTKAVPDSSSVKKGDAIGRNWFGVEAQIYYDFLGGMKIMGEYIMGSNVDEFGTAAKPASIRKRDFSGFYVMLVKNITEQWQFAAKYDSYNPNTKIAESDVDNANDLAFNTIGLGIHNYSFDNVRLSLWYDINKRAENVNVKGFETSPINNLLTVRFQYKF